VNEAQSQYGEDSPQYASAARTARTSSAVRADLRRKVAETDRLLANARRAAQIKKLEVQGKLPFDPNDFLPSATELALPTDVPGHVTFVRTGLKGKCLLAFPEAGAAVEWVRTRVPRVELIHPQEELIDVATASTIESEQNDFMRGIFRYAGLKPEEWKTIFSQDDQTEKRLDTASAELNRTLRHAWTQGQKLRFKLSHQGKEIHLRIDDPSVKKGYVRASRRSSGFTHFFALKTMLHAREQASEASSFLWLFDEPGIYLHPQGQYDLIQELETIAQSNQVVYSTHSIFLINKNYPTRHRLLIKTEGGTTIDQKPYVGQWQSAIESLGLAFPGSFMFASKVLLVEGDSDPIMLNADLQRLVQAGLLDLDLNALSIMMTGDSKHADAMVRILSAPPNKPKIALLFDADGGGRERRKSLKRLIRSEELPVDQLDDPGTSLEDHLLRPDLFREAVVTYVEKGCTELGITTDARKKLEESYERIVDADGRPSGLARWSRDEGKTILEEDDPPSSVGIASEYARLLATAEIDPDAESTRRALAVATKIGTMLQLKPQTLEQEKITED